MDRDGLIKASNESRRDPRWTAVAWYRTDKGPIGVEHDFMELSELDELIERGPDWHALDRIEIRYNAEGRSTITIEQLDPDQ